MAKGFVYLETVQGNTLIGSYTNATGATVDSKWTDCKAGSFTDDDAVVHETRSGLQWNDVFVDAAGNVHPFIKGTAADDSFGSMEGFSSTIPTISSIADANKAVTVNDTATGYDLTTGSASTVTVAQGGTGQTSYTNGQLLIGNTTGNTLTKATLTGTANQVVVTNGTGSITLSTPQSIATTSSPTFAALTLTAPLTVPNGGLGAATFTDGGVLIGNGAGIVQVTSAGTAGQVLTSNGAGVDPTFQAAAGGGDFVKESATGIDGKTAANGTIFTPSANFVVHEISLVATTFTGLVSEPAITIGFNNPDYDNVATGVFSSVATTSNVHQLSFATGAGAGGAILPFVPSGQALKWSIASGAEGAGTTLTYSIYVTGYYLD